MPDAARTPDTDNADTFADLSGAMTDALDEVVVVEDLWEFRPTSVSEIQERAAHLPVNKHWDEVEPGCPLQAGGID